MAQWSFRDLFSLFREQLPIFQGLQADFFQFLFLSKDYYAERKKYKSFNKFLESYPQLLGRQTCNNILCDRTDSSNRYAAQKHFSLLFRKSMPEDLEHVAKAYTLVLQEQQKPEAIANIYETLTGKTLEDVPYADLCQMLGSVLVEKVKQINDEQLKERAAQSYVERAMQVAESMRNSTTPFQEQADTYYSLTRCYCENNPDRYIVARQLADNLGNVYACMWLGDVFYHGLTFKYGNINQFEVPRDYEKALYYYQRAAQQGYAPAMWAVSDMYEKGKDGGALTEEIAMLYLKKSKEAGYPPAINTTGIRQLRQAVRENNVELFEESARNFDDAAQKGYLYSYNQLYFLLTKDEYHSLREQAKKRNNMSLFQNMTGRSCLEHSVDYCNGWAMNRYALRYCTDDSGRAKELFRKAAEYGEPWGAFNYADKFCKNDNPDEYRLYMNQASKMGLAAATIALAEYLLEHPEQENGDISTETLYRTAATQIENDHNQDNRDINSRLLYLQAALKQGKEKRTEVRK